MSAPDETTPVHAALALAKRGIAVFPCNAKKRPLTRRGFKDATTDRQRIERWWQRHPEALIGLPTGSVSGVAVLDLDVKNGADGMSAVPEWESLSPLIARTPSGGAHVYFRNKDGLRCSTGHIAAGVDVRAEGGYVVVPPSSGYAWIGRSIHELDRQSLPEWPFAMASHSRPRAAEAVLSAQVAEAAERYAGSASQVETAPDIKTIEAALRVIPSDNYQQWFEVGSALRLELGESGFPLFLHWSQQTTRGNYNREACAKKWAELAAVNSFTAGTIFHYATVADPEWRSRATINNAATKPKLRPPSCNGGAPLIGRASELRLKTFEPLRWIVPEVLPEGVTLLVGKPKVGKSWLAADTAIAVASGGECLGHKCPQGDVLALFLEDNERRIQRRLTAMLGVHLEDWPQRLQYATEWLPLNSGGVENIKNWIAAADNPRLVIVDVLQRVRGEQKRRENLYAADYEAIAALQKLAGESGISILVLHHQRKAEAEDLQDTVSGTLGLSGAADATLVLHKRKDGMALYGRGRDLEEFEVAVEQNERFRWQLLGDASEVHVSRQRAQILAVLKQKGPLRAGQVAAELGANEKNVKKLLYAMRKDDQIDTAAPGIFKAIEAEKDLDL